MTYFKLICIIGLAIVLIVAVGFRLTHDLPAPVIHSQPAVVTQPSAPLPVVHTDPVPVHGKG